MAVRSAGSARRSSGADDPRCAGLARRRLRLPSLYWLAALAVMLFTLRGRGSDVNYFIEPAALACVLAARAVDLAWRRLDGRARFGLTGSALLAGTTLIWGAGT